MNVTFSFEANCTTSCMFVASNCRKLEANSMYSGASTRDEKAEALF